LTTARQLWFGRFDLDDGHVGCWQVGPLTMWIQRLHGEWRIAREVGEDANADASSVKMLGQDAIDLLCKADVDRYGVSNQPSAELTVMPMLADKAVVARPEKPFHLPAGQAVSVFVGSPLWLQISVDGVLLCDAPIFAPSSTWFGPNTMEGELCYASRTYLRIDRRLVHCFPHRAMTTVHINNRSAQPLDIESLRLPVARLALYEANHELWTQDVTFECEKDGAFAALQVEDEPPSLVRNATLVSAARDPSRSNLVVRAFSAIFS
jgi:hypothetical protein